LAVDSGVQLGGHWDNSPPDTEKFDQVKVVLRPILRLRLKENFDRFNFALYKEKQMADFRRWLIALAVLALMAGAASAQVGVASGTASGALQCTAEAAGTPELRPEGYTELTGDILITCTGGPMMAVGAQIPTTNIVVFITPSVPVTSRMLQTNGASEAILIIDEAGSNISTGATGGFGPQSPQSLCSASDEQSAGQVNCNLVFGTDASGGYLVAKPGPGNTTSVSGVAQNVFQGTINANGTQGVNTITFYDVPVLPPATSGVSRIFRITNIRVPVPGGTSPYVNAFISTNPNQTLPLTITTLPIATIGPGMQAGVKLYKNNPFQQCNSQSVALSANLIYTEGFATSFKTRVVPGGTLNGIPGNAGGNVQYAAEGTNTGGTGGFNQNVPGGLYGGFAANTESGLIFPPLTGKNGGSVLYTAGLADYGTRLKAVFYNIPAGLTLYVSTTSGAVGGTASTNTIPGVIGGTSTLPYAVLVATNSGEATADASPFVPIAGSGPGPDGLSYIAITANSAGAATAVWEVTNSNPAAVDALSFSVYIGYSPTAPTTTFPYGTPLTLTGLPPYAPTDVQMSYAPEPSQGAFSAANFSYGQNPIPRFAVIKTQEGPYVNINLCQTTLLYPFVTGASGFDTGLAVANTSWDPWGTRHQQGSCTLYGYGVSVGASGNTAAQPVIQGCDLIANPQQGSNCFPVVQTGQVASVQASGIYANLNFMGYVIAVCNFQYAHGYAALTDLGLRNVWHGYLALEIAPLPAGAVPGTVVGSPRSGAASIEELVH